MKVNLSCCVLIINHLFILLRKNPTKLHLIKLNFISQFLTDIQHVKDVENTVADTLSRIYAFQLPTKLDLNQFSHAQQVDTELKFLLNDPN